MNSDNIVDLLQHMLYVIIFAVAVIAVPGLLIGLVISMFQAATQINESTLSFLPKLFIMVLVIAFTLPWLMSMLANYTEELFIEIPFLIG